MSNEKLLEMAREQLEKREQERKEREELMTSTMYDEVQDQKIHADNLAKILESVSKSILTCIMQEECGYKPNGQKRGNGQRVYHNG